MKSWLAALGLVISAGCQKRAVVLSELQFVGALSSNWITQADVTYDPTSTNRYYKVRGQMRVPGQTGDVGFISRVHFTQKLTDEMLEKRLFTLRQ